MTDRRSPPDAARGTCPICCGTGWMHPDNPGGTGEIPELVLPPSVPPDAVEVALTAWLGRPMQRDEAVWPDLVDSQRERMRLAIAAADAARAPRLAPDENALPMELLPEGWEFYGLELWSNANRTWFCQFVSRPVMAGKRLISGQAPTPRAAFLAAVEAAQAGDG